MVGGGVVWGVVRRGGHSHEGCRWGEGWGVCGCGGLLDRRVGRWRRGERKWLMWREWTRHDQGG